MSWSANGGDGVGNSVFGPPPFKARIKRNDRAKDHEGHEDGKEGLGKSASQECNEKRDTSRRRSDGECKVLPNVAAAFFNSLKLISGHVMDRDRRRLDEIELWSVLVHAVFHRQHMGTTHPPRGS